jgi:hypothetical protein
MNRMTEATFFTSADAEPSKSPFFTPGEKRTSGKSRISLYVAMYGGNYNFLRSGRRPGKT